MKKYITLIVTFILLFLSEVRAQDYRVVFNSSSPKVIVRLENEFTTEDSIILQSPIARKVNYSYNTTADKRNVEITFNSVKLNHVGRYSVLVVSKKDLKEKEVPIPLKIITPSPSISSVKKVGGTGGMNEGAWKISWNNLVERSMEIEITGENFFFTVPGTANSIGAKSLAQEIIEFSKGCNLYADTVEVIDDKRIHVKLNLVRGALSGPATFQLINFDKEKSTAIPIWIAAQTFPALTTDQTITLDNNVTNSKVIACDFPFQVSDVYFKRQGSPDPAIEVAIDRSRLSIAKNELYLTIRPSLVNYNAADYNVVIKTFDGKEQQLPTNPFKIIISNPTFQAVEKYAFEKFTKEELPISRPSNIFKSGDRFKLVKRGAKDSIEFQYIIKGEGTSEQHFIQIVKEVKMESVSSGLYSVTNNGKTLSGEINVIDWPRINSVRWEKRDIEGNVNNTFNGSIYATGDTQLYRVFLSLEKPVELEATKWRIFGVTPKNSGSLGNEIFYDFVLPSTIRAGDVPGFKYSKNDGQLHDVEIKTSIAAVKEFSRIVSEEEFILIYPFGLSGTAIDFYKINGSEFENVDHTDDIKEVNIKVNNATKFKAGTQYLLITLIANGQTKTTDTIQVKQGEVVNKLVTFTNGIDRWDTLQIRVQYLGDKYKPVLSPKIVARKIYFYEGTKVSLGTGFPITSTIIYNIKDKDWQFSPLTLPFNLGWDFMDHYGNWKGYTLGGSVAVSSLEKLVDDDQKYFGLVFCGYGEMDVVTLFKLKSDFKIPLRFGLGAASEWKDQVMYVNPVVMFYFGFDILQGGKEGINK